MRTTGFSRAAALAIFTCAPAAAVAQATAEYESEAHEGHEEHEGPNTVELFIGTTNADHHGHREYAFTVGAAYLYAFGDTVSAGVLAEYASKSLDAWIVGVPVVFSLGYSNWKLTTMPGAEIENGDQEFLFRLGIGYEIEMQGYGLKPEINADWVDGDVSIVAGLGIAFRF